MQKHLDMQAILELEVFLGLSLEHLMLPRRNINIQVYIAGW